MNVVQQAVGVATTNQVRLDELTTGWYSNWVPETEKDPIVELDGSGTAKAVGVATTIQLQCLRTKRSPETEKDRIDELDEIAAEDGLRSRTDCGRGWIAAKNGSQPRMDGSQGWMAAKDGL